MLCDTIIDEVILSHLAVLDVHITWGAKLTSLITTDENLLRGVRVQKEGRELELVASVLVIDEGKDVDPIVFAAINANGLVYDGRLVVDETFRTTDPDIFAAGPLTKFSRKVCGGTYLDQHSSRVSRRLWVLVVSLLLFSTFEPPVGCCMTGNRSALS